MNHASDVVTLSEVLTNNALERFNIKITSILLRTATYIKRFPDFHGNRIDAYKSLGIDLTDYPTSVFRKFNPSAYTSLQVKEAIEQRQSAYTPDDYIGINAIIDGLGGNRNYYLLPPIDGYSLTAKFDTEQYRSARFKLFYGGQGIGYDLTEKWEKTPKDIHLENEKDTYNHKSTYSINSAVANVLAEIDLCQQVMWYYAWKHPFAADPHVGWNTKLTIPAMEETMINEVPIRRKQYSYHYQDVANLFLISEEAKKIKETKTGDPANILTISDTDDGNPTYEKEWKFVP